MTIVKTLEDIAEGSTPLVWGARAQITPDDTGLIKIPANADRRGLRFSNSKENVTWFILADVAPVVEEDTRVIKELGRFFSQGQAGTSAIRFICTAAKTTTITYQEAT